MVGSNFPNPLPPASAGMLKNSFSHNSPMYLTGSRIRVLGSLENTGGRSARSPSFPSHLVQPANHEVAVVAHRQVQTEFLRFSFLGVVWQDEVGMIDRTWEEPPMPVTRQSA